MSEPGTVGRQAGQLPWQTRWERLVLVLAATPALQAAGADQGPAGQAGSPRRRPPARGVRQPGGGGQSGRPGGLEVRGPTCQCWRDRAGRQHNGGRTRPSTVYRLGHTAVYLFVNISKAREDGKTCKLYCVG